MNKTEAIKKIIEVTNGAYQDTLPEKIKGFWAKEQCHDA